MEPLPIRRLERYTEVRSPEVLVIQAEWGGEPDEIMVFRGVSSSLMRATATDPDVPVLPAEAVIRQIARFQGPYNPQAPQLLEQGLTWEAFEQILMALGL